MLVHELAEAVSVLFQRGVEEGSAESIHAGADVLRGHGLNGCMTGRAGLTPEPRSHQALKEPPCVSEHILYTVQAFERQGKWITFAAPPPPENKKRISGFSNTNHPCFKNQKATSSCLEPLSGQVAKPRPEGRSLGSARGSAKARNPRRPRQGGRGACLKIGEP